MPNLESLLNAITLLCLAIEVLIATALKFRRRGPTDRRTRTGRQ